MQTGALASITVAVLRGSSRSGGIRGWGRPKYIEVILRRNGQPKRKDQWSAALTTLVGLRYAATFMGCSPPQPRQQQQRLPLPLLPPSVAPFFVCELALLHLMSL